MQLIKSRACLENIHALDSVSPDNHHPFTLVAFNYDITIFYDTNQLVAFTPEFFFILHLVCQFFTCFHGTTPINLGYHCAIKTARFSYQSYGRLHHWLHTVSVPNLTDCISLPPFFYSLSVHQHECMSKNKNRTIYLSIARPVAPLAPYSLSAHLITVSHCLRLCIGFWLFIVPR